MNKPTPDDVHLAVDLMTEYMIDHGYMLVLERDADMRPKAVRNTEAGLAWLKDESIDCEAEVAAWAREKGLVDE